MAWSESKWIVDNLVQKLGKKPQGVVNFVVSAKTATSVQIDWTLAADAKSIIVKYSEADYPKTFKEGALALSSEKRNGSAEVGELKTGVKYYFSAFSCAESGAVNVEDVAKYEIVAQDKASVTCLINIFNPDFFSNKHLVCEFGSQKLTKVITRDTKQATFYIDRNVDYKVHVEDIENIEKYKFSGEPIDHFCENLQTGNSAAPKRHEFNFKIIDTILTVVSNSDAKAIIRNGDYQISANLTRKVPFVKKIHCLSGWQGIVTKNEQTKTISFKGEQQSGQLILVSEIEFNFIFGIQRNIKDESPLWARTDDSANFKATATNGVVRGASNFNDFMPWKGIVRETLNTGDVMVKIPKFYYQRYRDGNVEHIRISDKAIGGFAIHPAFNHAGIETDYIYVGAYKTSSNNKSVSGASPQVSQARATMRNNARAKGKGWSLIDISAVSAIQMLILVEFANNNVQYAIGRGFCDGNSEALKTGTCDGVLGLTGKTSGTDGKIDVVWRGIEGFWGNVSEFVDGLNFNDRKYFVCNDITKYQDNTTNYYTALTANAPQTDGYIIEETLDTKNNHIILPTATGGSDNTYECDYAYLYSGWRVLLRGGNWATGSFAGLFCASLHFASSDSDSYIGSRLLYIPS